MNGKKAIADAKLNESTLTSLRLTIIINKNLGKYKATNNDVCINFTAQSRIFINQ